MRTNLEMLNAMLITFAIDDILFMSQLVIPIS